MKNSQEIRSPRELALHKTSVARQNLLLMIVLTAVNVVMLLFGSETMLLFSATVPYYAVVFGYYGEEPTLLIAGIVVAVLILLLYLLCWIFSKKSYAWMVTALVLFVLDSISLVALYIWAEDISGILDGVIHIWVLYYLVLGVKYVKQLKNLPEEEEKPALLSEEGYEEAEKSEEIANRPLHIAETEEKFRVLAEGDCAGHHVCYRRVKRTNELVIDGYVYDELEMLVEPPHELRANVDGNLIVAGFNGTHSYITLNGEQIVKKIRLM